MKTENMDYWFPDDDSEGKIRIAIEVRAPYSVEKVFKMVAHDYFKYAGEDAEWPLTFCVKARTEGSPVWTFTADVNITFDVTLTHFNGIEQRR